MKPLLPPAKAKQLTLILEALLRGERLTVLTALQKYGVFALSQRIGELERDWGWLVKHETLKLPSGKRIAVYSL